MLNLKTIFNKKTKQLLIFIARFVAIIFIVFGLATFLLNLRDSMIYMNDEKEFEELMSLDNIEQTENSKTVDQSMKELNEDYQFWISIENTKINYPVLQSDNNDYYLNHRYTKEKHPYGSIFLDYRNIKLSEDKHIAIYGHSVNEKAMFGYLSLFLNEQYLKDHSTLVLKNDNEERIYEIFSIRLVDADYETLTIDNINAEFDEYYEYLWDSSYFSIQEIKNPTQQILTLVSCDDHYLNGRILVHLYLKSVKQLNNTY